MAHLSVALYEAHRTGASIDELAQSLSLPPSFVEERIEAARLCLLLPEEVLDAAVN
jgi:hypothetical protein